MIKKNFFKNANTVWHKIVFFCTNKVFPTGVWAASLTLLYMMCSVSSKNLGKLNKWGTKEVAGLKYSESGFLRLKISSNRSHGVMNVNVKHLFLNINKTEEVRTGEIFRVCSHPGKKRRKLCHVWKKKIYELFIPVNLKLLNIGFATTLWTCLAKALIWS